MRQFDLCRSRDLPGVAHRSAKKFVDDPATDPEFRFAKRTYPIRRQQLASIEPESILTVLQPRRSARHEVRGSRSERDGIPFRKTDVRSLKTTSCADSPKAVPEGLTGFTHASYGHESGRAEYEHSHTTPRDQIVEILRPLPFRITQTRKAAEIAPVAHVAGSGTG